MTIYEKQDLLLSIDKLLETPSAADTSATEPTDVYKPFNTDTVNDLITKSAIEGIRSSYNCGYKMGLLTVRNMIAMLPTTPDLENIKVTFSEENTYSGGQT